MRITNGMLIRNMMSNLNSNLNRMERYQRQAASGRKFEKPSEDPIGMSKSLKLYTDISKVDQYERNLNDANSWMHSTENALIELGEILQRTRELCVDAANGPKTPEDTQKTAKEIEQLREQVIKLANSRHAGRSIFTGLKTDKDLLDKDGNYIISVQSNDVSIYNVGISENIKVNTVGMSIFGVIPNDKKSDDYVGVIKNILEKADTGIIVPDGTTYNDLLNTILPTDIGDIKAKLKESSINIGDPEPGTKDELLKNLINEYGYELEGFDKSSVSLDDNLTPKDESSKSSVIEMFDKLIENMKVGNFSRIGDLIDETNSILENTLSVRAEIGAKTNRLEMTEKRLSSEKLNFRKVLSLNEDVDYGEVIMESKMAENVYNASLAIGSKIIQPTLVDFLR